MMGVTLGITLALVLVLIVFVCLAFEDRAKLRKRIEALEERDRHRG